MIIFQSKFADNPLIYALIITFYFPMIYALIIRGVGTPLAPPPLKLPGQQVNDIDCRNDAKKRSTDKIITVGAK